MERVRPITVLALLTLAVAGVGCVTVDSATKSVKLSVLPEASAPPATQVLCMWQRRLTPLPDPTRDGMKVQGLPGQLFLLAGDGSPAEVQGDLAIVVYDETRRPNGAPPHQPELWHFTADVLKRLVTTDERFGKTFALFLPWPPHWRDVTSVRIGARYVGHDKVTDLTCEDTRLALDLRSPDAPVWTLTGAGQPIAGAPAHAAYDQFGVPDPTKLLRQARTQTPPPMFVPPTTQPAGATWPPMPPAQPTGPAPMAPVQTPIQPAGGIVAPTLPLSPSAPAPEGPAPIPIPARMR